MKKEYFGFMAVVIIVAIAAFYGGIKYDQSQGLQKADYQAGQGGARNFAGAGRMGGQGVRSGGGSVMGEVINRDNESLTVKLGGNGGTKIVLLPNSTNVSKSVDASSSDVVVGKFVIINGKANTDGSVTAQSVQLRDALPKNGLPGMQNGQRPQASTDSSQLK
ncbi:MAG: hypothetical protein WCG01_04940 [bacterium]